MRYEVPLKELSAARIIEIRAIVDDFIKGVLARSEKIDGRYTGSELTTEIYKTYLKSLSEAEQIQLFEDVLLFLSGFAKPQLRELLSYWQVLSLPALITGYQNKNLPDFLMDFIGTVLNLSTFKNNEKLVIFIKEQAIESRLQFLKNTASYVENKTPNKAEPQDLVDDLTIEEDSTFTEEEIITKNNIAMHHYKEVVRNLMLYCNFLTIKLAHDKNINTRGDISLLERVHNNCIQALEMIDTKNPFEAHPLPIDIENLIKYTNFVVQLELELDTRIMKSQNIITKAEPTITKEKKPISYATKVVNALSKLLEALFTLSKYFNFFSSSKPSKNNEIQRDVEADNNKKALMLFYDKLQPGMEDDLKTIRDNIAKLRDLPKPK